jgi:hypothetical protein
MFPLMIDLHNGIHLFVIGGVFPESISECLTMVCYWMAMLREKNLQHSQRHQYQYGMIVADEVRRVVDMSTSDASDHQMIVVVQSHESCWCIF